MRNTRGIFALAALAGAALAAAQGSGLSARPFALMVADKAPAIVTAKWVKGEPVEKFENGKVLNAQGETLAFFDPSWTWERQRAHAVEWISLHAARCDQRPEFHSGGGVRSKCGGDQNLFVSHWPAIRNRGSAAPGRRDGQASDSVD